MGNKAILVQGGDGTAIPAGMVGEKRDFTSRATVAVSGSWTSNSSALDTLPAGRWQLYHIATWAANNSANGISFGIATNGTADATGLIATGGNSTTAAVNAQNASSSVDAKVVGFPHVIDVATTQAIYAKSYADDASVSVTFYGYAIRIA